MACEIAVLVEDTCTCRGFLGEHGISIWVNTSKGGILFDTGAGNALIHNARKMGIDLGDTRTVVLSHGHDDHTGGLEVFLRHKGSAPVIACPGVFDQKYRIAGDTPPQYIGAPLTEEQYVQLGARFTYVTEPTEINEGIWVSGPVPRTTDFELQEPTLFVKTSDGHYVRDPVADDQSLGIVTSSGLTVILGCAHAGVVNTLRYIIESTGLTQINTVIGGPHLLRAMDSTVFRVASELKQFGVRQMALCHCLGTRQSHLMFQAFGPVLTQCETGSRFTLD